jgi:L-ascorbate metabolism protein UlaG (beta-lactamase superfamily)
MACLSPMRTLLAAGAVILSLAPALAQESAPKPTAELADRCPGLIADMPDAPRVIPAGFLSGSFSPTEFLLAALGSDQVRITYVGHSTFLIESPRLVRIATDYNDYVKPPVLPDIATMNHAHSSHYTDRPDPAIKYVLRGWGPSPEEPARHDITYEDVRVRNVPTNIRDWGGGTERHGNSIFIFETAQMCIAHLGHLHHTLNQQQLNEMGRVDIVLAPVDGSYTLDLEGMVEVLKSLKPQVVIPMHYFSAFTLDRFLSRMRQEWDVEISETPSIVISKTTLPAKPKVLVLPGR